MRCSCALPSSLMPGKPPATRDPLEQPCLCAGRWPLLPSYPLGLLPCSLRADAPTILSSPCTTRSMHHAARTRPDPRATGRPRWPLAARRSPHIRNTGSAVTRDMICAGTCARPWTAYAPPASLSLAPSRTARSTQPTAHRPQASSTQLRTPKHPGTPGPRSTRLGVSHSRQRAYRATPAPGAYT